jgi:hypothetical protein
VLSATLRAFDAITTHLAVSGTQTGHLPRPGRGGRQHYWHQSGALGDERAEDRRRQVLQRPMPISFS